MQTVGSYLHDLILLAFQTAAQLGLSEVLLAIHSGPPNVLTQVEWLVAAAAR